MAAAVSESKPDPAYPSIADRQALGQAFAASLNCGAKDISCLRSKSTKDLNTSTPLIPATSFLPRNRFMPFVDGTIVPADPYQVGSKVPLLAGTSMSQNLVL